MATCSLFVSYCSLFAFLPPPSPSGALTTRDAPTQLRKYVVLCNQSRYSGPTRMLCPCLFRCLRYVFFVRQVLLSVSLRLKLPCVLYYMEWFWWRDCSEFALWLGRGVPVAYLAKVLGSSQLSVESWETWWLFELWRYQVLILSWLSRFFWPHHRNFWVVAIIGIVCFECDPVCEWDVTQRDWHRIYKALKLERAVSTSDKGVRQSTVHRPGDDHC
jgi:hypothetical protein